METEPTITPLAGHVFEDTIDGYFPLQESIRQMLVRQEFSAAIVCLNYAPAMEIPDLAPDAPVPLYVTDGFGCMINRMTLVVRYIGGKVEIEGLGDWKWFDGPFVDALHFSPFHRLAEPAFIKGVGFRAGKVDTELLGSIEEGDNLTNFALLQQRENKGAGAEGILNALNWQTARMMYGNILRKAIIHHERRGSGLRKNEAMISEFILSRDVEECDESHSFMINHHWCPFT